MAVVRVKFSVEEMLTRLLYKQNVSLTELRSDANYVLERPDLLSALGVKLSF